MVPLSHTDLNGADDITKGIATDELNGPEFLQLQEQLRQKERGSADVKKGDKKRMRIYITRPVTVSQPVLRCESFSSWRKLLRVMAFVFHILA